MQKKKNSAIHPGSRHPFSNHINHVSAGVGLDAKRKRHHAGFFFLPPLPSLHAKFPTLSLPRPVCLPAYLLTIFRLCVRVCVVGNSRWNAKLNN